MKWVTTLLLCDAPPRRDAPPWRDAPRRDAPPPDPTLTTYSEAIEVPGTAQRVFIHRGHAGDVAALVLIEGLGGLTLYNT